jgi:hypothetical protein
MWRRRITGHALAATKVAITFRVIIEPRYPIFNRFMCLNSEKNLMVVSQVEGSYYRVKGGSL